MIILIQKSSLQQLSQVYPTIYRVWDFIGILSVLRSRILKPSSGYHFMITIIWLSFHDHLFRLGILLQSSKIVAQNPTTIIHPNVIDTSTGSPRLVHPAFLHHLQWWLLNVRGFSSSLGKCLLFHVLCLATGRNNARKSPKKKVEGRVNPILSKKGHKVNNISFCWGRIFMM